MTGVGGPDGGGASGASAAEAAFVAPRPAAEAPADAQVAQAGAQEAVVAQPAAAGTVIEAARAGSAPGSVDGNPSVLAEAAAAGAPRATLLDAALARDQAQEGAEGDGEESPEEPAATAEGSDAEGEEPPVLPGTGAENGTTVAEGGDSATETEGARQAEVKKAAAEAARQLRMRQKDMLGNVEALSDQDLTRAALLALAGNSRLPQLAYELINKELQDMLAVKPLRDRGLLGKIKAVAGLPFAPLELAGRAMIKRSINETDRESVKRDALIQEHGRAALEVLRNGTPEMQAVALDAQIPTEIQRMSRMPEGKDKVALKAQIAEMRAQRDALTQEDGTAIPNKFQEMARDFEGILGQSQDHPDAATLHPVDYLQEKLVEVVRDDKNRKMLLLGLESSGKISKQSRKDFSDLLRLPYDGPKTQTVRLLTNTLGMTGGLALVALWFRLKQESAQAAGGGGGGRRGH